MTVKVVTWNIRQGGQKAIQQIADTLIARGADVMVITEFKNNATGEYLVTMLKREGWPYTVSSNPPGKENGILVASVYPLETSPAPFDEQNGAHRWLDIYIQPLGMQLLGVHIPNVNEVYKKRFFWDWIIRYAEEKRGKRAMIVGDFNTTRRDERVNAPLQYSNYMMRLLDDGWIDAWKKMNGETLDYSWFSHKNNGFRLDYMFLSPVLSGIITACAFSHRERELNYSDHSVLEGECCMNA